MLKAPPGRRSICADGESQSFANIHLVTCLGSVSANDWESPSAQIDLRPGGAFSITMRPADRSQEGFDFGGTYREVMKPERIAMAIGDGRAMTWTLDEVLGGTKLTLSLEMAMDEDRERGGYTQILDHFAAHLATLR